MLGGGGGLEARGEGGVGGVERYLTCSGLEEGLA